MDIGEKIRLLRGNMTQAELSRRAEVDKAIISKIETGKMQGTVDCHKKIAAVFGLKLSEFYSYLEEENPQPVEFHSGAAKTDSYQDFLEILSNIPLAKMMLPTFIALRPKEEHFLEETLKKAERFIIVLEGKVEIEIEGKTYQLKKEGSLERGDSLYSMSPKRHRIKNIGGSPARLVCVSAPPIL